MPDEARCVAKKYQQHLVVAGVGKQRAFDAAMRCAKEGVNLLVSFGVAGAIKAHYKAGDFVNVNFVLDSNGNRFECVNAVESDCGLISVDTPILKADEKRLLERKTNCDAVDMESAAIAQVASEYEIPFICFRVVSDSLDRNLPSVLTDILKPNGRVRLFKLLISVLNRPGLIVELMKVSRDYKTALKSLKNLQFQLASAIETYSWQNS